MIELSVVIPTYNRAGRLQTCLEALTRQTQPASDFEVIVVIDGSTDETLDRLRNFQAPFPLRPVWQHHGGQPRALNQGIAQATGRYCLFLDDDVVASPQLVAEHLQAQHRTSSIVGIGQLTLSLPADAGWYARAHAQGWRDHYEWLNREDAAVIHEDCYSGNMSAPREVLVKCGGFAEDLVRSYDVELAYRLARQGCSFVYLPGAVGCQDERKGFRELSRDAERAGVVDVMLYRRDPHMLSRALASFPQGSWRKLLLRRLLLAFHTPPRLLELLGRLMHPARRYGWYSFIHSLCYWRGVRWASPGSALWRQLTSGTAILMYHAVGRPDEPASAFVIPEHRLAAQLRWLERMGYRVTSLEQFLECQRECRLPPARSVVITFDDGYADNHTRAWPLLRRRGFPATIFLVADHVDHVNRWDEHGPLAGRPLMSWSQIKEMADHGIRFGAHSCTHAPLTSLSAEQAAAEITDSRDRLERRLGLPIEVFAYPYGEHAPGISQLVEAAGFAAGCTATAGLNALATPAFALCRTEIQGTDSLLRFCLALWFGDAEAVRRRGHRPARTLPVAVHGA
jgi:peptidoglycan/xylan/chitin deacetylase (PgdA/CDA1 family)/glycosyltransferase involved in cell wall biosynthesis